MLTLISKKYTKQFSSIQEIKKFIIDNEILYGEIKELKDLRLQEIIDSNEKITVTEFNKIIKKMYNCGSLLKIEYWINRGFSEKESREKVFQEQSKRAYAIPVEKRKNNAKKASNRYIELYEGNFGQFSCFHKDYWIKKGYDEKTAKLKAKETNSKTNNREYLKSLYTEEELKIIDSKKSLKGNKNGMFGKVPAIGAGNGISGHYKNFYFRSSYEYFWMKEMEKQNIEFICLDDGKSSLMTILINENKTYTADFYIPSTKTIVDIKNDYSVNKIHKIKEHIQKFCILHKLSYETIQPNEINIDWELLEKDVNGGLVIIDEKKIEKYKKVIENNKNAKNNSNKISIKI